MESINKFKEQLGKITRQLGEIKKEIGQTARLIDALSTAPLPPENIGVILASMVDAAGIRYLEFLQSEEGIPETLGGDITALPYLIEETSPLSGLFLDRSGWDEVSGRPSPSPLMRPDALCYFFGDIIKEKLSHATMMLKDGDGREPATPYAERIAAIETEKTRLKALKLQEEELEAALEDAREAFDLLDGV